MYDYVFEYLGNIIKNSSLLVLGDLLPDEVKYLKSDKISVVSDNMDILMKLKENYKNINLNQSIYFIKDKFDYLIALDDLGIDYKGFLKETGSMIKVTFISNEEDYGKLLLKTSNKNFIFREIVNLYKKEAVLALRDFKKTEVFTESIFSSLPDVVIEFYSDIKPDIENSALFL